MQKKYHFISGLPRSGSTLLTGILCQNPRFYSNISDLLLNYFIGILNVGDPPGRSMVTEQTLINVISGVFDSWYEHIDKEIIFNCNRTWPKHLEYLFRINENFKIICCVRNYNLILNSFEKVYKTRRLKDSELVPIYGGNVLTVWHRSDYLATDGTLRIAYNSLKEAYYGLYRKHLLLVEYDDLTKFPKETMKKIYDFIEEPYYNHDFDNIEYTKDEYDLLLNAPGLHTVGRKVLYKEPDIILPPDVMEKYSGWEFWRG